MIKITKQGVLIRPEDIKPSTPDFEVLGALNPGAMRMPNGDIILYVRVIERLKRDSDFQYYYSPRFVGTDNLKIKIDKFSKRSVLAKEKLAFEFKDGTKRLTYLSHFRRVILDSSGMNIKSIDEKPSFYGVKNDGELGVEDARITKFQDQYIMTYVTLSRKENVSTSLAISNDCITWHRRGIIFREQNKDVVLFPQKINNYYVAYDRSEGTFKFSMPHIWVSYSKDLEYWGKPKSLVLSHTIQKSAWDSGRNGAGAPPIETSEGWLLIYHGVIERAEMTFRDKILREIGIILGREIEPIKKKIIYCVGAALFDLQDPKKLIAKTKHPLISPKKKYEKGTFEKKDVVFPTGAVLDSNKDHLLIYCGAGDRFVTFKKMKIVDIFTAMEKV